MTLVRAAVASRLPRHLIKTSLRLTLIMVGGLIATTPMAVAQTSTPRPVARMITSGPLMPASTASRATTSGRLPRGAVVSTPAPEASASVVNLERRAFELINSQRRASGQQPLSWDGELSRLARQHSEDMASSDFFNHQNRRGMTMVDRARARGIKGWSALGENIAYNQGYDDPAAFVAERWMVSSKHRDNLLNARWTRSAIGVAVASDGRVFFTQVFIAP